jgi:hypothetical protein
LLDALSHSQTYQDYERAFSEATGLPVTLRPLETWQLPLRGKRKDGLFVGQWAPTFMIGASLVRLFNR